MSSDIGKEPSTDRTRRSVLVTIGGCATVGLAGCSGGGDGGGGDGNGDGGENRPTSVIPGAVVHNSIDGVTVRYHWATSKGFVKLRVENESDETLTKSYGEPTIIGRTLTSEGNVDRTGGWRPGSPVGPSEVKPGTEATIGFLLGTDAEEAARYQLCLSPENVNLGLTPWSEVCGGSQS